MQNKARYIMLGGFLGAGKTTAILKLARWLAQRGRRVGLITNDQGVGLVDTRLLTAQPFPVEEISGGCFCCRFNSLTEAARRLSDVAQPDVLIAEPVGSCTDLVATVAYPLRQIYGADFSVAPVSVLVDPIRAARVLGLQAGSRLSDKVLYIYERQLFEADTIVINKRDLLDPDQLEHLRKALSDKYPAAALRVVSARQEIGLESWFEHLLTAEQSPKTLMEVDYQTYAEGEALLGWLNAIYTLHAPIPWDGNDFLRRLTSDLQRLLQRDNGVIAHLKMTLEPGDGLRDLAVVNLTCNDAQGELAFELADPLRHGQLTINLRAEATPEMLRQALQTALQTRLESIPDGRVQQMHLQFFKPGKPTPIHRMGWG